MSAKIVIFFETTKRKNIFLKKECEIKSSISILDKMFQFLLFTLLQTFHLNLFKLFKL